MEAVKILQGDPRNIVQIHTQLGNVPSVPVAPRFRPHVSRFPTGLALGFGIRGSGLLDHAFAISRSSLRGDLHGATRVLSGRTLWLVGLNRSKIKRLL
jgi:hypothetical protein